MKTLLTLFVLLFSSSVVAEDISNLEIEGISIGDSLLDYTSRKNILDWKEKSKRLYWDKDDKYFEVYLEGEFKNYDYLSFFIKSDDDQYLILAIYGAKEYKNMIGCNNQYEKINNEFSLLYKKTNEFSGNPGGDTSGKSTLDQTQYQLTNGDVILIECYDYDESVQKNEFPNPDSLAVSINKKEIYSWLNEY
ncbi:hypothetical protein OAJ30_01185 [Alphaproteobacteria bacterium]|nr:hypothetical protein [Alphaproteobacteria bacterium]